MSETQEEDTKDFFISYTGVDEPWAEWLAWTLKEAGYSVILQAWDFDAGGNFVLEMHRAAKISKRTMCVLSEDFLKSNFTKPEWAAAFADDPTGTNRKIIPVRVRPCSPNGLLKALVYIDLVDRPENEAAEFLLQRLRGGRPTTAPRFPGKASAPKTSGDPKPNFPANSSPTSASPPKASPPKPQTPPTVAWDKELKRNIVDTLAKLPEFRNADEAHELVHSALEGQAKRDGVLGKINFSLNPKSLVRQLMLTVERVDGDEGPYLALILDEVAERTDVDKEIAVLRTGAQALRSHSW